MADAKGKPLEKEVKADPNAVVWVPHAKGGIRWGVQLNDVRKDDRRKFESQATSASLKEPSSSSRAMLSGGSPAAAGPSA